VAGESSLVAPGETGRAQRRTRSLRRLLAGEAVVGWLFVLPATIGFVTFFLYPILRVLQVSLTDWNLLRRPRFVGLANYLQALGHDPQFWHSVNVTALYVLYNIPIQTVLGFGVAVLMDRVARSVAVRAVVIAPYLISNVVAAILWLWMLDPLLGTVNVLLRAVGLPPGSFLSSPGQALASVAAINIWRHTGFTALLFYAGLQAIPRTLYEAAQLDGAGELRLLWHVTLPLIRPVMGFVLVTSVIGSFQIFDTVAVATDGGPVNSTRALVYYIYENGFRFFKMGYASALSVLLFAGLAVISLLQMRVLRAGSSDLS
jgi:multiple sugar transport system permease protein